MGRAHEVRAASILKTSLAKSKKYSRWGKEIYQAAKTGLPDPAVNQTLKRVIEKAKKDQCPADIIKRAIDKAKGALSGACKEKIYEGYGPSNVAIIVECLTDNDNRTYSEVRNCFTKTGSNIGQTVSYMFERKGIFEIEGIDQDDLINILLENDHDYLDIIEYDDYLELLVSTQEFNSIKEFLEEKNMNLLRSEITLIPNTYVEINYEEQNEKFNKLISMLEELDDVNDIYHNKK